jgi:hypothetical protein
LGYSASDNPTIIDEGTTVDHSGSVDYRPRSEAGTCDELIADQYMFSQTILGPYRGPVATIHAATGNAGRLAVTADWPYVAHEQTSTLIPDPNGCDWSNVERDINRVEDVLAVGLVSATGTVVTFDARPDPFTHVTGKLVAAEVVQ